MRLTTDRATSDNLTIDNSTATQPVDNTTLTDQLKYATRDVHQRLHGHPMTALLLSPTLSHDYYIRLLRAFYGFYTALESSVPRYRSSSRVAWLRQDLYYFGNSKQPLLCCDIPVIRGHAALLGCWYVVEGSSLGSASIYRHLHKHLGLSAANGARFFFAYGQDTGANWRELKTLINSALLSHREQQQTINTAMQLFSCLEQWLSDCYGEPL